MTSTEPTDERQTHRTEMGSQSVDLPIVSINETLAIALAITVDLPLSLLSTAGAELAERLAPQAPDIVVTAATLGIPVAREVSASLGHDEYVVLHKTAKIHLADALTEPLRSITTDSDQRFRLDRARLHLLDGKRVAFVDDVVSTGGSVRAALQLIRRAGGDVVAIGALLTESNAWIDRLGADADLVRALGSIPIFKPASDGSWTPA